MSLAWFAARRVAGGAVFALVVASLTLVLARSAPGDAATVAGLDQTDAERAALRAELGLDQPFLVQYGHWLRGLLRLDLGRSTLFRRPVADLVGERFLNTGLLAVVSLVVATAIGVPLGRYAGSRTDRGSRAVRAVSLAVLSVPPLVGALALVYVAAVTGWLPAGGMTSAGVTGVAWAVDLARHLPVPTLALALPLAATLERLQAGAIGEVMGRPFVVASRARGLDVDAAVRRHAWPVSLAPVLGTYGVIVGGLFSGSFVVEIVTAWPGIGRLMMDALRARDVWLVAGCGAAGAVALAIGTTIADVVHAAVDPRVRTRGAR
ncbi:MAG: ABC transporter permease [Vicinamibacterales bacterium]